MKVKKDYGECISAATEMETTPQCCSLEYGTHPLPQAVDDGSRLHPLRQMQRFVRLVQVVARGLHPSQASRPPPARFS